MALVRANSTFAYSFKGVQIPVNVADIWEDTDPLVREHPEWFTPITATTSSIMAEPDRVEMASAAPGEQRNARRH